MHFTLIIGKCSLTPPERTEASPVRKTCDYVCFVFDTFLFSLYLHCVSEEEKNLKFHPCHWINLVHCVSELNVLQ